MARKTLTRLEFAENLLRNIGDSDYPQVTIQHANAWIMLDIAYSLHSLDKIQRTLDDIDSSLRNIAVNVDTVTETGSLSVTTYKGD